MNTIPYSSWREGMEGIVLDMPEDVYRKSPGVNVSSLKPAKLSLAHYRFKLEEEDEDRKNSALIIGTLVHTATLQRSGLRYVVRPAQWDSWRTKDSQVWRDSQIFPVLTPAEEEIVVRCAKALSQVELINDMAATGDAEVSCFRRHHRTGLLLKGRCDLRSTDADGRRWGLDVKSVLEGMAETEAFSERISKLDYHLQAAFYTDLFNLDHFVFVAVEKEGYPGVSSHELDPDDLELGRRTYNALLQKVAEGRKSNIWPGYPLEIRRIRLRAWKRKQEMEDVE